MIALDTNVLIYACDKADLKRQQVALDLEAKEWQVQHVLLKRLQDVVRRENITHAEIAKRAATSRTRVTAILNGDLEHVSSDLLIRILASLGYRVRVSVVRSKSAA